MAVSLSMPNCKKVRADNVHRLPRPAAEPAPIVINRLGMTSTKGHLTFTSTCSSRRPPEPVAAGVISSEMTPATSVQASPQRANTSRSS